MKEYAMRVLVVGREDYGNILHSVHGLKAERHVVEQAELIIDKDTGKILKSRYF